MQVILRFVALTLLSATLLGQAQLEIVAAYWGNGNNFADVTARVRSLVRGNRLDVLVNSGNLGVDPLPGVGKVLRVYYLQNGQFNQSEWREDLTARLSFGGGRDFGGNRRARVVPLRVQRAVYGAGNQVRDVTGLLQSRVANNRLELPVTNETLGGDPANQQAKQLQITYAWAGQTFDIVANENDILNLPDGVTSGARLRIVKAQYGMLEGNRLIDVTGILQRNIVGDRLVMQVTNNTMQGDPARGAEKNLYIVYEFNGQRVEKRVPEDQQLVLP